ncbi:MAG: hypothetical protein CBB68_04250 [Rhodospirillaceae bacterium TMED8]|nr:hypothetical protein [Magnetovibrio sp.]OUT51549.1 MAG: hypothetical protein CBB68_04250 [Rhodospirillaceae bacterium TMED8]|tara:strand:- start:1208 stop:2314 length:1107 start_codon:yes stop_codon:yes gene_type:complete
MPFNKERRLILKRLGVIASIALTALLIYEVFFSLTHVYEYDARIEAKLTTLSSRIDGEIEKVYVAEGDRVKKNDLLVALKARVQRLKIEALEADLIREQGQRAKIEAEVSVFKQDLASRLATKREAIKALQIEHTTIRNRFELAKKNLTRARILFQKKLTSKKSFEEEQSKTLIIEAEVDSSLANIKVAKLELREIEASASHLEVLEADKMIKNANIRKINNLKDQQLEILTYHYIRSPIDGIVDSVYKYTSEHVEEAERIILLHDENSLWIQANVDESQLRHLEIGQKVIIDMDAYPYPFEEFKGIVTFIGSVTASQVLGEQEFSEGRSRKLTQRIPIRIKMLDPPEKIAPGMLVEVNIQIYDQFNF